MSASRARPRLRPRSGATARALAAAIALALVLGGLGGCARLSPAQRHPAAVAIEKVLELRREKATDAKAYARYFARSEVATSLADSAKEATSGQKLVPDWSRPYVSAETSKAADVVVRWRKDGGPRGFPAATVFKMQRAEGGWVAVDASEIASASAIPQPLSGSVDR